ADVALMTNTSVELRWQAVSIASGFGTRIGPAIPALVQRLQDTNEPVALVAVQVLSQAAKVDPALVVSALASSLQDKRHAVRKATVETLRGLHIEARPAVPALRVLLSDRDPRIRDLAANTLDLIELDEKIQKALAR